MEGALLAVLRLRPGRWIEGAARCVGRRIPAESARASAEGGPVFPVAVGASSSASQASARAWALHSFGQRHPLGLVGECAGRLSSRIRLTPAGSALGTSR